MSVAVKACQDYEPSLYKSVCELYSDGIIQAIGMVATSGSLMVFVASVLLARRTLQNNREADMFFRVREYYLEYVRDVAKSPKVQLLEISDEKARAAGLDRDEMLAYYKIILLIERVMDYKSKFKIRENVRDWESWVGICFQNEKFRATWNLFRPMYRGSGNAEFTSFMDKF